MKSKKLIVKAGRPVVDESTKSYSVSLRPSQKTKLEKKFQTLSKAIKTLL